MERRELLRIIAFVTGGAMIGGGHFLSGCKFTGAGAVTFTPETIALLDEVAETIIPATSTPGARAAKVGAFMSVFVSDCYEEANRQVFLDGIRLLDEACTNMHGLHFMEASGEQRRKLFEKLNREAKAVQHLPPHYFTLMVQLTLLGFFTSQTGATETLRHVQVPGKYDGEFPYRKGDRAWADSL